MLTRARRALIVVGHAPTMLAADMDGHVISFLKYLDEHHCLMNRWYQQIRIAHLQPLEWKAQPQSKKKPKNRVAFLRYVWNLRRELFCPGDVQQYVHPVVREADAILACSGAAKFLGYIADLKHHIYGVSDQPTAKLRPRPESVFQWDRKALSHLHFFGGVGVSLVPGNLALFCGCLLYTSPSPRDGLLSRMPSSA